MKANLFFLLGLIIGFVTMHYDDKFITKWKIDNLEIECYDEDITKYSLTPEGIKKIWNDTCVFYGKNKNCNVNDLDTEAIFNFSQFNINKCIHEKLDLYIHGLDKYKEPLR